MIANKNEFGGSQFYHLKSIVSSSGLYFIGNARKTEGRRMRCWESWGGGSGGGGH